MPYSGSLGITNTLQELNDQLTALISEETPFPTTSVREVWSPRIPCESQDDYDRHISNLLSDLEAFRLLTIDANPPNVNRHLRAISYVRHALLCSATKDISDLKEYLSQSVLDSIAFSAQLANDFARAPSPSSPQLQDLLVDLDELISEVQAADIDFDIQRFFLRALTDLRDRVADYTPGTAHRIRTAINTHLANILRMRPMFQKLGSPAAAVLLAKLIDHLARTDDYIAPGNNALTLSIDIAVQLAQIPPP